MRENFSPIITIDHHFSASDLSTIYRKGVCYYRINPARIGIGRSVMILESLISEVPNAQIFIDTLGNKVRVSLKAKSIILGRKIVISSDEHSNADIIVPSFFEDYIEEGDKLKLKGFDKLIISVDAKTGKEIVCTCNTGNNEVKNKTHIYFLNKYCSNKYLNDIDLEIIRKFVKKGIIALSFADSEGLLLDAKQIIPSNCKIYAKIESPEGVKNIDEIIKLSDGIIVGRDDLSIFFNEKEIYDITKICVDKCNAVGKECIPASNLFCSIISDESISDYDMRYLKELAAWGVNRVYCNESVMCNDRTVIDKIISACQEVKFN